MPASPSTEALLIYQLDQQGEYIATYDRWFSLSAIRGTSSDKEPLNWNLIAPLIVFLTLFTGLQVSHGTTDHRPSAHRPSQLRHRRTLGQVLNCLLARADAPSLRCHPGKG